MTVTEVPQLRISSSVPLEDDEAVDVDWTVALAGGRVGDGQPVPAQYRQLLGARTMLQHTLARSNQLTPASRTLAVIGAGHAPYAMPQLAGAADHVFCQPSSRDTGVASYVALAMIKRWTPNATVTLTPTDHLVGPEARYVDYLRVARTVATRMRDTVVILGARPHEADAERGYLRVGDRLTEVPEARRVVGVVGRPSQARARQLIGDGALWNTTVACGTVDALWELGRGAEPHLVDILDSLVPLIGTRDESDAIDYIYNAYLPVSFEADMLARTTSRLAVVELEGVAWSDFAHAWPDLRVHGDGR